MLLFIVTNRENVFTDVYKIVVDFGRYIELWRNDLVNEYGFR